ncbi:MAG: M20/M25/M40 family metallo-hydrolase [Tannerellaceae bacterium]|jgi:Zn-dependent M28 family amino/carboxypeptidase|nr:M20/M25/M40 family metallo-hydrolase [Tannerellaceae bacterium]
MKQFIFILLLINCSILHAQEDVDVINRRTIESHLSFLAGDALEGRQAGKRGGRVAAEYIKAVLQEAGVSPLYDTYFQSFEAYSPAREKSSDFQVHPDSVEKYRQLPAYRRLNLQNVVACIEGERKDEYIVIGAHYDHVGVDELLVGDQVYNGADDNASGVAALLQVAKAFAGSRDKPLRSIIFAFWDGEEVNYLGSEYFVAHFPRTKDIKASINLDMISREGLLPILYPEFKIPEATEKNTATGNRFHLLYTHELAATGRRLQEVAPSLQPAIEPLPSLIDHGSRGSDALSFSLRDIPVLWFFTGLHPDYHTPSDEADRIDFEKLTAITKLVYISLYHLSNDE